MSWIALSDGRRALRRTEPGDDRFALLTRGSLVVEVLFRAEDMAPQAVLRLHRDERWKRKLDVILHHDGAVLVEHRQGPSVTYAALKMPRPSRDDALRITYSWDAPLRMGILSVENLDTGALTQHGFDAPQPIPVDDADALVAGGGDCLIDPTTAVLAVSDQVEPAGLPSGVVEGGRVGTPAGPKRVERLRPGDLVVTEGRGYAPVRQVIRREVPAFGRFRPVALRAPYLGLNRDLAVGPDHRLLIRGADAEYLFGADGVLVEARHLARTPAAMRARRAATVCYVHVILDRHDCLLVSGAWSESLYLGDGPRDPARLAAAALADCAPSDLPRHHQAASPLLRTYEAMVLVSALSA